MPSMDGSLALTVQRRTGERRDRRPQNANPHEVKMEARATWPYFRFGSPGELSPAIAYTDWTYDYSFTNFCHDHCPRRGGARAMVELPYRGPPANARREAEPDGSHAEDHRRPAGS